VTDAGDGVLPVLVVDDDSDARRLITLTLQTSGYETVEAEDGATALELLRKRRVSLVILDWRLPGMDGIELLAAIRASPQIATIPVIMLTGNIGPERAVTGLDAGANDYITKPFVPSELVARVRSHMRERQAWVRAMEAEWSLRADVAQALWQISPQTDAESTAVLVCREVARLPAVRAVAVVIFRHNDAIVVTTDPAVTNVKGRRLDRRYVPGLVEKAAVGPWLWDASDPPVEEVREGVADRDLAGAPLTSADGTIWGLLVVAADSLQEMRRRALALAADFAPVASSILRPAIEGFPHLADVSDARAILNGGRFTIVFQPVVELSSRLTIGYEALTRFDEGLSPQNVFADAHRQGVGAELELAAVSAALVAAENLPDGTWLSVNLSPSVLAAVDDLVRLLDRIPRPIVVEITEHDPISDYSLIVSALERLSPNVVLAVDDAGAGYATLGHVLALRPAFIKLDRNWITHIDTDRTRQALVAGLVFFAIETKSQVIAEGIEREEELMMLRRLGVRLGQGYLLGRPAPLASPSESPAIQ
jgi:EAL domain-containing protein (putative c-di-GMP-specific phosphodiesterase class I)/DNA-binding response OmpR family regulator